MTQEAQLFITQAMSVSIILVFVMCIIEYKLERKWIDDKIREYKKDLEQLKSK